MLSDDLSWCLSCLVNEFLLLLDLDPGLESEYIPAALHSLVERTFASFFASSFLDPLRLVCFEAARLAGFEDVGDAARLVCLERLGEFALDAVRY